MSALGCLRNEAAAWEDCGARQLHIKTGQAALRTPLSLALPPSDRRSHMTTPSEPHGPSLGQGFQAFELTPAIVAPLLSRFHAYYHQGPDDECWEWMGPLNSGYGVLGRSSTGPLRHVLAHRVAWVAAMGRTLAADLSIDHLCRNRPCVNYNHLEPVPIYENVRRIWSDRQPSPTQIRVSELVEASQVVPGRGADGRRRRACAVCGLAFGSDYLRKHITRRHVEAV